jgi:hypothetical protein
MRGQPHADAAAQTNASGITYLETAGCFALKLVRDPVRNESTDCN